MILRRKSIVFNIDFFKISDIVYWTSFDIGIFKIVRDIFKGFFVVVCESIFTLINFN